MTHILVIHKVQDFKKWKPVFDGDAARRKSAGSRGCRLFQSEKDSNEVAVLCQWKDLGAAHQFVESADTHRAMENAGVVGEPDLYFLEEAGSFSA
jgi:heme-degrading monooxygenase HmoA